MEGAPTMSPKIALITGANSGIGFTIAQRLLNHSTDGFRVVLCCRNRKKASDARDTLLKEFPSGLIDIIIVDVGSVDSVFRSCKEIKKKYDRIDLLFCNAGIFPCAYLDWWTVARQAITDPKGLLIESTPLIQPVGATTSEGLGETFACNVFGHYIMIRQLEDVLASSDQSRIIWTSSRTAKRDDYNPSDYQCFRGPSPYESSKYVTDVIAIALNSRLNKRNIHSFTTHPGVVATNIVYDHLGWAMDKTMKAVLYTGRSLGIKEATITGWNGSYANYVVATEPIENLNKFCKYGSYAKPWGSIYCLEEAIICYDEKEANDLLRKLDDLLNEFRKKNKYGV
ncbi:4964_t:CDS:2 [Acaulospora morrowiae]|uniref:4964_t:CDS:1 n=1 Tax=Acaulospora morrowiae TaxID=94023 RepID=A0A9N8ZUM8_9GLOM|nr:4964_t:CDS:2 [Acaulospora morrowiae]